MVKKAKITKSQTSNSIVKNLNKIGNFLKKKSNITHKLSLWLYKNIEFKICDIC